MNTAKTLVYNYDNQTINFQALKIVITNKENYPVCSIYEDSSLWIIYTYFSLTDYLHRIALMKDII